MTRAISCLSSLERALHQLATSVLKRHRSHLRELRIVVVEDGVILQGNAVTFYGKQIALHEVRSECKCVVVGNQIEVLERSARIVE
jgi:hypothetical protein